MIRSNVLNFFVVSAFEWPFIQWHIYGRFPINGFYITTNGSFTPLRVYQIQNCIFMNIEKKFNRRTDNVSVRMIYMLCLGLFIFGHVINKRSRLPLNSVLIKQETDLIFMTWFVHETTNLCENYGFN